MVFYVKEFEFFLVGYRELLGGWVDGCLEIKKLGWISVWGNLNKSKE